MVQQAKEKFPYFQKLFDDPNRLAQCTFQNIPSGTYAFFEGEYYPFVSLVLSGTLRVSKIGENGREIVLYRVHQGESCVLLISSALSGEAYQANAYVEEDAAVIHIPISIYKEEMLQVELVQKFTYQLYNQRLANMMSIVEEITFNRMDKRLIDFILNHTSEQKPILEITHEKLALELGTAREVISRLLKDLEKKGYLQLKRGKITITNRDQLALFLQSM